MKWIKNDDMFRPYVSRIGPYFAYIRVGSSLQKYQWQAPFLADLGLPFLGQWKNSLEEAKQDFKDIMTSFIKDVEEDLNS